MRVAWGLFGAFGVLFIPLAFLASPLEANQQSDAAYLVRDIADGPSSPTMDSVVRIDQIGDSRGLIWAQPQSLGLPYVLWSTNGAPGTVAPVTDLLGGESGISFVAGTLCADSDRIFFWSQARDGDGERLWSSDGTTEGTVLVLELPLQLHGRPSQEVPFQRRCEELRLNGRILFWTVEFMPLDGPVYQLWSTEGVPETTELVKTIGQDPAYGGAGIPDFVNLGDSIVFSAQTLPGGAKLWRTDGTAAGTWPFLDTLPETEILLAEGFVRVGASAFFVGWNGADAAPLAVSDGTAIGTHVFPGLIPDPVDFSHPDLRGVALGDRLLLPVRSNGELQLYAFTPADVGAIPLTSIEGLSWMSPLTARTVGGRGLFVATRPLPPHAAHGLLIASDGSEVGTVELSTGCDEMEECSIAFAGQLDAAAYFVRSTPDGAALWGSDGTDSGTNEIVPSICEVPCSAIELGTSGNTFFFMVLQDSEYSSIWASDGTAGGTRRVLDGAIASPFPTISRGHANLSSGRLLFSAVDDFGLEPWISDGTEDGTGRLANLFSEIDESFPGDLSPLGSRVLFGANTISSGREPWVSDGSTNSTQLVADMNPGIGSSNPLPYFRAGTLWPFAASPTGSGSRALYFTDGTGIGTQSIGANPGAVSAPLGADSILLSSGALYQLFDSPPFFDDLATPGSSGFGPPFLAAGTDRVYFRDQTAAPGNTLWESMGTDESTHIYCSGPGYFDFDNDGWIGELEGGVVFRATELAVGTEVYFCNEGETAILLADVAGGPLDSDPSGFVALGAVSLFAATDSSGDRELWRTDGTPAGTFRLIDISQGGSSSPEGFMPLADQVLFSADDGIHGRELWITDGTPENSRLLADLAPGPMSSSPRDFELVGGAFIFSAETIDAGRELWVTAATEASTHLLSDVRPGPLSSRPEELTNADGRVFFRAADEFGSELWAVCPSWVADAQVQGVTVVEGEDAVAHVVVTLARAPACGESEFKIETVDAEGVGGTDYTSTQQEIRIGVVGASIVVDVPILDDAEPEDGEGIGLLLRDALGRVRASATIWIVDDDDGVDADGDGIESAIESSGPGNGDANGDGISDALQPGVATYVATGGAAWATLEVLSGCLRLADVQPIPGDGFPGLPEIRFPSGLLSFRLPDCAGASLRWLHFGELAGRCSQADGWKSLSEEPEGAAPEQWIELGADLYRVSLPGGPACAADFEVVDGAPGDLNPATREIQDPAGIGLREGSVAEIPALGAESRLALALILGVLALVWLRKRFDPGV